MIHGTVDGLQAKVNIIIRLAEQLDIEFECIIDTGFEGALTLPPAIISKLGLPYLSEINAKECRQQQYDNQSPSSNYFLDGSRA